MSTKNDNPHGSDRGNEIEAISDAMECAITIELITPYVIEGEEGMRKDRRHRGKAPKRNLAAMDAIR